MNHYIFEHGVTRLVVTVESIEGDVAVCRIVRRGHPRRTDQSYYRWLHGQPGPGDEITLPVAHLRPCSPGVRCIERKKAGRPYMAVLVVLAFCLLCYIIASMPGCETKVHRSSDSTATLLAQQRAVANQMEKERYARSLYSDTAYRKLSRHYYQTGRSDQELVEDLWLDSQPIIIIKERK